MKFPVIVSFLSLLLLQACGTTPVAVKREPVDVHLAPECRKSCREDLSPGVDLSASFIKCDARRALCMKAIDTGIAAGAIK